MSRSRDRGATKLETSTPYKPIDATPDTNEKLDRSEVQRRKVVMEMQPLQLSDVMTAGDVGPN